MEPQIPQENTPPNMQDVKHRSIRDLKIHRTFKRNGVEPPPISGGEGAVPPPYTYPETTSRPRERHLWKWIVGLMIVVVVLFVVFASLFTRATVAATPRFEQVVADIEVTAYKNPGSTDLGYTIVTLSKEGSTEVPARGEEQVDTKAQGEIIVFNNYSAEPQRLVKNTRFETPEGLIFRISESIDVPGQTTNAAGDTVPGSIEVTVYADTSGEEYNIPLTDFTVPGFEGEPQFEDFYARSKTAMTGGFSGVKRVADEEDIANAREDLRTSLETELKTEVGAEVPEEFVFFDNAVLFTSELIEGAGEGTNVSVTERVTAHALVFNEVDLARYVAENTVATYDGASVRLDGLETFTFSFSEPDVVTVADEEIPFSLAGNGTIVWTYDESRLKEDLAGKHRRDTEMVLSGYPAIEEAQITIFPFWKRSFPGSAERIIIKEEVVVE